MLENIYVLLSYMLFLWLLLLNLNAHVKCLLHP